LEAVPESQFFLEKYDVFSFGVPPCAIEIITAVKGVYFDEAYQKSTLEKTGNFFVNVIHLNNLLQAKAAAGRYKDLNDIENLPSSE
jgi:hypothetical protein